jgi:hypothetical protein
LAVYRRDRAAASAPTATPAINPPSPSPEKSGILPCAPVNTDNPLSIQQLAELKSASVQDKYFSIPTLKAIISKALRAISQIAQFNRRTPIKPPAGYAEI